MKISTSRYAYMPISAIVVLFLFVPMTSGMAETIDGFRDLKFGMTEKEVEALEPCSSPTSCLYEIEGKNRYLDLSFQEIAGSGKPIPKLARITIDMGWHTDQWYAELHHLLGKSYKLTQDFTDHDMDLFRAGQTNELITAYADARVLLSVARRKFGNLIIKVVYQNGDGAEEWNKR